MKKRIGYVGAILAIMMLALCGCDNQQTQTPPSGDDHTHAYGEWKVVKEATCTVDGEKERVCTCGEKETDTIKASGHKEVKTEAVAPSCTASGKTEGAYCSICNEVLKEAETIEPQHKETVLEAVAPSCTAAGKTEGTICEECGDIIVRQSKVPALGHEYKDGKCTRCKKAQPDMAAAIIIDQLNEEKQANFITKKAYPAGSTITFWAYAPKGSSWWAVSWTTDAKKIGLYDWAEGNGSRMNIEEGKWQKCTVTLPNDGKNYYIYVVGAKGEWSNQELLIDDVVITNASGKVVAKEDFANGVEGIFSVVKTNPSTALAVVFDKEVCEKHQSVTDKAQAATCDKAGLTEGTHCEHCGKILKEQQSIEALGHDWENGKCKNCGKERENLVTAIVVDQINDSGFMNFITKDAYPGGSTIKVRVLLPKNVTGWAAVCWTTDPADGSIYAWAESGLGQVITAKAGEWTEITATLPNDGKEYYIYFVGEKGQFKGKELQLDAFRVYDTNGNILAEDDFDNGVENGIFSLITKNPTTDSLVVYDKKDEDPCKNGHAVVDDPAKKPNCTETGKTAGSHCSVCDTIIVEQKEIPSLGHDYDDDGLCKECGDKIANKAVAITIDQLNEAGKMNFITRVAYAGGSVVKFNAYVPAGTGWWAVSYTTDPTNADLYKWTEGKGQAMASVYNKWAEYSITLPDDGQTYYIYIVGAKGEWNGKKLQIDEVKIYSKLNELVASDNFNAGMHSGIFSIIDTNPTTELPVVEEIKVGEICKHTNVDSEPNKEATCTEDGYIGRTYCLDCGETVHEATVVKQTGHKFVDGICSNCGKPEKLDNSCIAITIDQLNESGKMNFITKKAYAGGSKITFRAYVPAGTSWWAVSWTTDPSDTDLYKWTAGLGKAMTSVEGQWAEYEVTLPDDGKEYYIYIVGAKTEWKQQALRIDDFKIVSGETTVEENFDDKISDSIFDIIETNPSNESTVVAQEKINNAASILIDGINESGKMNFITKKAYAGGSKIAFRAYVPAGTSWWAVSWTTDPSDTDLYKWTGGLGKAMTSVEGQWAEYEVTLPDDGKEYYIYIVGAKTEWKQQSLLIDDVTIWTGDTKVSDDFNQGVDAGLFDIIRTNPSNGSTIVTEVYVAET